MQTHINISMDQWWLSPDTYADQDEDICCALLSAARDVQSKEQELLRLRELAHAADDRTIVPSSQSSDTGPDVSALYHTNSDRLPPHILLS
jgi:hypothetical protein